MLRRAGDLLSGFRELEQMKHTTRSSSGLTSRE
jgi:hypothetical protein